MKKSQKIDNWDKFFQKYNKNNIALFFSNKARSNIIKLLIKLMFYKNNNKKDKILDFGVSSSENSDSNPFVKYFIKKKYKSLHGCGLDDELEVKSKLKGLKYKRIKPNTKLPYKDNYFSISISHAVFEHLGNFEKKKFYLSELLRISKKVFITVPNRYFPIEHHSNSPLLGYLPSKLIYKILVFLNYNIFKSEKTLTFNSVNDFNLIIKKLRITNNFNYSINYTGLLMGKFSSHFYVYIEKKIKN